MTDTATFTLSIEPTNGPSYQHGFHLGTIEATARQLAVERFNALNNCAKQPTRTVALLRGGEVFDVYDGLSWQSQLADEAAYETAYTLAEVRALMRKARAVYVQPRFGCAERWVRITKAEAAHLIGDEELDLSEFPCGRAAELDGKGNLYLG